MWSTDETGIYWDSLTPEELEKRKLEKEEHLKWLMELSEHNAKERDNSYDRPEGPADD